MKIKKIKKKPVASETCFLKSPCDRQWAVLPIWLAGEAGNPHSQAGRDPSTLSRFSASVLLLRPAQGARATGRIDESETGLSSPARAPLQDDLLRSVVLHRGDPSPENIRQCLEKRYCRIYKDTTRILWVEARDAAKHPTTHRTVPYDKIMQLKMSLRTLRLIRPRPFLTKSLVLYQCPLPSLQQNLTLYKAGGEKNSISEHVVKI